MPINTRAGTLPDQSMLVDVPLLVSEYYTRTPDLSQRAERVAFGTSGHRGSSLNGAFNERHILAITQAIVEFRRGQGIDGPLFIGIDTHALSRPALGSALEVLAANGVQTFMDSREGYTPTPALSHAILTYNRGRTSAFADGIVVTPSHNPPEDGGFKYNPPNGGPADTSVTGWIQDRANALLEANLAGVKRMSLAKARAAGTTRGYDYLDAYVADLPHVIDLEAIRASSVTLGVDPLGGAGVEYWGEIAERYKLPLTVLSDTVDPSFRFMALDWDGRIRMDCSSPFAMQPLIAIRDRFDVAWACDTDHDRHGVVARGAGLLNPNHFLATCIAYLAGHRPDWRRDVAIGKTIVSSSIIDRLVSTLGRRLYEVPVGFKWFVSGLADGSLGFVGEESAGATFLRRDGQVWTTDKDGIICGLLAAEMTAVTGRDPGERYAAITEELGAPVYQRIDAPATREQKAILAGLSASDVTDTELAGERIIRTLTTAPGDNAPIGGLKVETANGWFAARPSGTEEVYKLYAESFLGEDHLARIQAEAQALVSRAFAAGGAGR